MARAAIRRHHPRQEPSALDAHAGICAGGAWQRASLPRPGEGPDLVLLGKYLARELRALSRVRVVLAAEWDYFVAVVIVALVHRPSQWKNSASSASVSTLVT